MSAGNMLPRSYRLSGPAPVSRSVWLKLNVISTFSVRLYMHIAATPSGTEIILQNGDAGNTNINFKFINSRFVICDYVIVWNILL